MSDSQYRHHIKNTLKFYSCSIFADKENQTTAPKAHKTRAFILTCLAFLIRLQLFTRRKNRVFNSKLLIPRGVIMTRGPSLKLSVFIYINRQFIFRAPPAKPKHPHRAAFWRAKGLKPMGRHQFNHNQAS